IAGARVQERGQQQNGTALHGSSMRGRAPVYTQRPQHRLRSAKPDGTLEVCRRTLAVRHVADGESASERNEEEPVTPWSADERGRAPGDQRREAGPKPARAR